MKKSKKDVKLQIDEDSKSFRLEVQDEFQDLKTHVDFSFKAEEDHKKVNLYFQLNSKMLYKILSDAQKSAISGRNVFEECKAIDKNCIYVKNILLPLSHIKGLFYLTFLPYKGLSLNFLLNDQKLMYARTKVHYFDQDKWRVKWFECLPSEVTKNTWITEIQRIDLPKLLGQKFLIDVSLDRNTQNKKKFPGIQNEGSTCYMNSVLQVLFFLVPLRKKIVESKSNQKFIQTLRDLFLSLMISNKTVSISQKLKDITLFDEYPHRQQDIHEFLISLIDKLEVQCPEVKQLWLGKEQEIITSKDKRYSSKQEQNFKQLQLHMTDISHVHFSAMKQSLQSLLKEEKVDQMIETEKYGKILVTKKRKFESLPPVLFMSVKRYKYNVRRKQLSKNCHELTYPSSINLNFLLEDCTKELNYVLYAITVHKGRTPSSGHYFSFINTSKKVDKPEWYEFNDSHVHLVRSQQVYEYTGKKKRQVYLNEQFGRWHERSRTSEQTAYLLVYIREDEFHKFQNSHVNVPQWFIDQEQRKLSQLEEKQKNLARFYALTSDKQRDFQPFADDLQLTEIKLTKNETLKHQFIKVESFLTFKVGTVWRVHKKSKSIKFTGRKYNKRCSATVKMFTQNKTGFRKPDYFLIFSEQNSEKGEGNLGILHVQYQNKYPIKRQITVHKKQDFPTILNKLEQQSEISFDQESLNYFLYGWNDYLFITVS